MSTREPEGKDSTVSIVSREHKASVLSDLGADGSADGSDGLAPDRQPDVDYRLALGGSSGPIAEGWGRSSERGSSTRQHRGGAQVGARDKLNAVVARACLIVSA